MRTITATRQQEVNLTPARYPVVPLSVNCVWDQNERAFRTRYFGFPFESSLAYIEQGKGGCCVIRAWIEVFDDALDSELCEYNVPIPAALAGDGEEVAKRLLEVLCREWLDY